MTSIFEESSSPSKLCMSVGQSLRTLFFGFLPLLLCWLLFHGSCCHAKASSSSLDTDLMSYHHYADYPGHDRIARATKQHQKRKLVFSPVDYGNFHPFDIMERRRRKRKHYLRNLYREGEEPAWYDPSFNVDDYIPQSGYDVDDTFDPNNSNQKIIPEPTIDEKFSWNGFQPIRIRFDTRYLDQNSVDAAKDEFIKSHIIPAAIQFWTKALMVYPAKRLFVNNEDERCGPLGNLNHQENGLNNADLMLYISADKNCKTTNVGNEVGSIAGARSCDWDRFYKPIGGMIDFCYSSFEVEESAQKSFSDTKKMLIEVAIHEIGHVLGLTSDDMAFYWDRTTGLPRTPSPEIVDDIICVNGKTSGENGGNIFKPSSSTLRFGAMYPGIKYYEVVTTTVVRVARNHFNCSTMSGLRLENQPTSNDCFGDHWEERLAWDSTMSATLMPHKSIPEYLSPFTLALLEDSGWYKANYTMAKNPSFGHGAGCDFVERPCIVEDEVPDYAIDYFCNTTDKSVIKCDPTHRMMASCNLYDLSKVADQTYPPIPQVYRYFKNPALGPLNRRQADWCPMFSDPLILCASAPSSITVKEEESFGINSRCYNSNKRPFCLDTFCDPLRNAAFVRVGQSSVQCEYDGQNVNVTIGGEMIYIQCPKFAIVCPDLICAAGCGGSGTCDWSKKTPECIFSNDLNDPEENVENSTESLEGESYDINNRSADATKDDREGSSPIGSLLETSNLILSFFLMATSVLYLY